VHVKAGRLREVLRSRPRNGKLVELGQAVGVIAAQSIGEPGRSSRCDVHIGGTASRVSEQSTLESRNAGTVRSMASRSFRPGRNLVVMNRSGSLVVQDAKGRDRSAIHCVRARLR